MITADQLAQVATEGTDWTPVATAVIGALAGVVGVAAGSRGSRTTTHRQWVREARLKAAVDLLDAIDQISKVLRNFDGPRRAHTMAHARRDGIEKELEEIVQAVAESGRDYLADENVGHQLDQLRDDLNAMRHQMDESHDALRQNLDELGKALDDWQRASMVCLLVFDDASAGALNDVLQRINGVLAATTHRLHDPYDEETEAEILRARGALGEPRSKLLALLRVDFQKR